MKPTKVKIATTIKQTRVLVVLTSGLFSHENCTLKNVYQRKEFSGYMEVVKKSTEKREGGLAWYTTESIVAKAVQYAYDYVFIGIVGYSSNIKVHFERLAKIWIHSTVFKISIESLKQYGVEDSVYRILEPCKAISPTPSLSLTVNSGGTFVEADVGTLLAIGIIDESDSFNSDKLRPKLHKWLSDLLLDDKWKNESTLKNIDVCIARFSGLNASEDYELKSQCLKGMKNLPHYQYVPAVLNNFPEPWQDIKEVQHMIEEKELFEGIEADSEALDGNSQIYLCLNDLFMLMDESETQKDNLVVLVISDMDFDGLAPPQSETRPLKNFKKGCIPHTHESFKDDLRFRTGWNVEKVIGLQINHNKTFEHPSVDSERYRNLNTVFGYTGSTPNNIFHAEANPATIDRALEEIKMPILDKLIKQLKTSTSPN